MKATKSISDAVKEHDYEKAVRETDILLRKSEKTSTARSAVAFSGGIIFAVTLFLTCCMGLYMLAYEGDSEVVLGTEIFVKIFENIKSIGFSINNVIIVGLSASFIIGGITALVVKNTGKVSDTIIDGESEHSVINSIYEKVKKIKSMQGSIKDEVIARGMTMAIITAVATGLALGVLTFFINLVEMHIVLSVILALIVAAFVALILFLPCLLLHFLFYAIVFSIFAGDPVSVNEAEDCKNSIGNEVVDKLLSENSGNYGYNNVLAEDGVPLACLYVGKKRYAELLKMSKYPNAEQRDGCLKKLEIASKAGIPEGEFVYMVAKLNFGSYLCKEELEKMSARLTELKSSGRLPEYCLDVYQELKTNIQQKIRKIKEAPVGSRIEESAYYKQKYQEYYGQYMGYDPNVEKIRKILEWWSID